MTIEVGQPRMEFIGVDVFVQGQLPRFFSHNQANAMRNYLDILTVRNQRYTLVECTEVVTHGMVR